MSNREIEKISKALGDPYRLKIVQAICKEGWMQCGAITDMLDLAQSTVSHHTKQLVDADLLIVEKEGRTIRYGINKSRFEAYLQLLQPYAAKAPADKPISSDNNKISTNENNI
ncbi:transcriptional regulator, ArsR family [Chitinophaga rupis]|uniref:Transcriptional regulator, ArsR family n=1 Tax=Chitinophaga rupis TaxID=573321 RepID=A0A1H7PEX2_9BACT|nr:metalloregulator ArsR/SmtB family transcription factor [Chitinophaga rupis]SEL33964.1 transcriptional regulator, ArsR family [Chitinophaga rupis]